MVSFQGSALTGPYGENDVTKMQTKKLVEACMIGGNNGDAWELGWFRRCAR
jgi:hypothetical protein